MSNLNIALKYKHQYGFSVVPIPCGKKGCVISWKEFQSRHASDDEIREWWANDPDANVGVVTGDISDHLAVFDIDYYKDGMVLTIMQEIFADYAYPVSLTPSGGQHWWFRMDKQIKDFTPIVDGLDFRNLGLIVLPPSIGANGKRYSWESKLKDIERPALPQDIISIVKERFNEIKQSNSGSAEISYVSKGIVFSSTPPLKGESALKNYSNKVYRYIDKSSRYKDKVLTVKGGQENVPFYFRDGRRDNDMFTVVNALSKNGNDPAFMVEVLTRLMLTWGEHDPDWIVKKVESALKRNGNAGLTERIKEWVLRTKGVFLGTDVDKELNLGTTGDKNYRGKILRRLVKDGTIERVGSRNGQFRLIDNALDEMDWRSAEIGNYYGLKMPLGLHNLMNFYPKNIMVVAGAPNAGKTSFVLNIAKLNRDKDICYFNSEMGPEELRERLYGFEDSAKDTWDHVKFYDRNRNFADVIRPNDLNIIDFLEVANDFFLIAEEIRKIHDRLDKGVAVICLQKKKGAEMGRGAEFSLEKPRIYFSLDFQKLKIVKCKNYKHGNNVNGKEIEFRLINGATFIEHST